MRKVAALVSLVLVSAIFSGVAAKNQKLASHKQSVDAPIEAQVQEEVIQGTFEDLDTSQFGADDGVQAVSRSLLQQYDLPQADLRVWGRHIRSWEHQGGGEIFVVSAKDRAAQSFDKIFEKLREVSLCASPTQNQVYAFTELEERLRSSCSDNASAAFLYRFSDNYELTEGDRFAASYRLALVVCHAQFTQVAVSKYQTLRVVFRQAPTDQEAFLAFVRRYFRFAFFNSFAEICLKSDA